MPANNGKDRDADNSQWLMNSLRHDRELYELQRRLEQNRMNLIVFFSADPPPPMWRRLWAWLKAKVRR